MVSVLAFYSDDLSLIPMESTIFSVKVVVEKNENKQKEAKEVCTHFKNIVLIKISE